MRPDVGYHLSIMTPTDHDLVSGSHIALYFNLPCFSGVVYYGYNPTQVFFYYMYGKKDENFELWGLNYLKSFF